MADYDTGYGKPPGHTKFRKGESGNKNGRPKNSDNRRTILQRELEARVTIIENGRKRSSTSWEMIVKQQVIKGMKGELKAAEWIAKYAERFGLLEPAEVTSDFSACDEEILNTYAGILDDGSIEPVSDSAETAKD